MSCLQARMENVCNLSFLICACMQESLASLIHAIICSDSRWSPFARVELLSPLSICESCSSRPFSPCEYSSSRLSRTLKTWMRLRLSHTLRMRRTPSKNQGSRLCDKFRFHNWWSRHREGRQRILCNESLLILKALSWLHLEGMKRTSRRHQPFRQLKNFPICWLWRHRRFLKYVLPSTFLWCSKCQITLHNKALP